MRASLRIAQMHILPVVVFMGTNASNRSWTFWLSTYRTIVPLLTTKLNVADDATKWVHYSMPQPDNRWFTGPDFLKLKSDEWPE